MTKKAIKYIIKYYTEQIHDPITPLRIRNILKLKMKYYLEKLRTGSSL